MPTTVPPNQNIPLDQPLPPAPRKSSVTWILLLILFLLLYGALNVWIYFHGTSIFGKKLAPIASEVSIIKTQEMPLSPTPTHTPRPTLTPTPTPRPIPHGKGVFGVSTDKPGPKMTEVSVDPYDPPNGGKMLITVSATNTEAITSVIAIMETDHKTSQPIPFTLASGTDKGGAWQGTWTADDSYLYTYNLKLSVKSTNGEHSAVLTLR